MPPVGNPIGYGHLGRNDLAEQHRLAVLGDPHEVELYVIDSVGGLAAVLHNTASLLKPSPEGKGFSANPRGAIKGLVYRGKAPRRYHL